MEHMFPPVFNFILLLVVLFVLLRKPVAVFVLARHNTIRTTLHEVRDQLAQSKNRFEEFTSKLKAIDAEVDALKKTARTEAQDAQKRIVDHAQKTASIVVTDAKSSVSGMGQSLRAQLRAEVGAKIADRAEILLRGKLTGDDRARIRQEFSSLVGGRS